jgi:nitrogen-specific signal transduction histidine kinase
MSSFKEKSPPEIGNVYQEILLQKYVPPCMLVNQQEKILLVNGELEKYLSTSGIKTGSMLPDIVDRNIYQELKKGIKEVMQGEESVLVDGRTFHERYIFYIYFTPVIIKPASEKLILIEFEDIHLQTVKAHPHTATDFQQDFDELLSITGHDIRNLVSNFIMLLKFEDGKYTTDHKIEDVNKVQERFLSNFHLNLSNLAAKINRYFL